VSPKEIHDIKAAMRTLEIAQDLLEMGYRFDDQKASLMIERLGFAIKTVNDTIASRVPQVNGFVQHQSNDSDNSRIPSQCNDKDEL